MSTREYAADGEALQVAADTIGALRAVCLALETAVTHVTEQLGDAHTLAPDARLAVDRYEEALHQAWEAYGEVFDAVTVARPQLPGSRPVGVATIMRGLRTAREHATHAAGTTGDARPRVLAAADRLARSDDPYAQAAAARLRTALARLDQLGGSLGVGTGALDRYFNALANGYDPPQQRLRRLAARRPLTGTPPAAADTDDGDPPGDGAGSAGHQPPTEVRGVAARTAASLVAAGRHHVRFRTFWQLVRHHIWQDAFRTWRSR
ncbi:hypothetical protein ACN27J_08855 [Solwaraspora sp. WMMB762]|uniref:hypothetical protein n=1 Tax=Solwaraspora sp. WMMB762 TaxID=3404120 RepID=UPI003B946F11